MAFKLVKVPLDEKEVQIVGMDLVLAANDKLDMKIDPRGFLAAWLNGMKVLAETDTDGNYIGLAFMVDGRRWYDDYNSATIVKMAGANLNGMMDFAKTIASASGAYTLVYETGDRQKIDDQVTRYFVDEVIL